VLLLSAVSLERTGLAAGSVQRGHLKTVYRMLFCRRWIAGSGGCSCNILLQLSREGTGDCLPEAGSVGFCHVGATLVQTQYFIAFEIGSDYRFSFFISM